LAIALQLQGKGYIVIRIIVNTEKLDFSSFPSYRYEAANLGRPVDSRNALEIIVLRDRLIIKTLWKSMSDGFIPLYDMIGQLES
jgi:hypothetical protein